MSRRASATPGGDTRRIFPAIEMWERVDQSWADCSSWVMHELSKPPVRFELDPLGQLNRWLDDEHPSSPWVMGRLRASGPLYADLANGSLRFPDPLWAAILPHCICDGRRAQDLLDERIVKPDYPRFLFESWKASARHGMPFGFWMQSRLEPEWMNAHPVE